MIDKILIDLEAWDQRQPTGVVAYDGDLIVDSDYCDDVDDYKNFFREHQDDFSAAVRLVATAEVEGIRTLDKQLRNFILKVQSAFYEVLGGGS